MKKTSGLISGLMLCLFASLAQAESSPLNENINYTLNTSRSSWLIRSASGDAKVTDYQAESENGPGYVVTLNYNLDVLMRGKQTGTVGLFVPEAVFGPDFMTDLAQKGTMSMGGFSLAYEGMADASDSSGKTYKDCQKVRVYDVKPKFRPGTDDKPGAMVLWHEHRGSITEVYDLQVKMKIHDGVPVLGAVQLDISGTSNNGIPFEIGMDMVPR